MSDVAILTGNTSNNIMSESNDGLLLATILEQSGINIDVVRFADIKNKSNINFFYNEVSNNIFSTKCKIVVFQTHWHSFLSMIRIAQKIKRSNSEIVNIFVGPQASHVGYDLVTEMPFIDYVYIGEPENHIIEIIKKLLSNNLDFANIPSLICKKNTLSENKINRHQNVIDINSVPWVDFKFYKKSFEKGKNIFFPLNIGRGCPYGCTFCNICLSRNRLYRMMSVEKIIDTIKYYQSFNINNFWITHDSFLSSSKKVIEFCEALENNNINIKWRVSGRIDNITHELIDRMMSCGFDGISFGIESGSDVIQKIIKKNLDLNSAFDNIKYIKKRGLFAEAYFMYGFPQETKEDLVLTLDCIVKFLSMDVKTKLSLCCFSSNSNLANEYYDKLYYNPKNFDALKNVIGFQSEEKLICEHKSIFSYLYDYDSEIRCKFQYLGLLFDAFSNYKLTVYYLHEIFGIEKFLSFYRSFVLNSKIKDLTFSEIKSLAKSTEMIVRYSIQNILENKQYNIIHEIYSYETNLLNIKSNETKILSYNFNYTALKNKESVENLKKGNCNLLIRKFNTLISINEI